MKKLSKDFMDDLGFCDQKSIINDNAEEYLFKNKRSLVIDSDITEQMANKICNGLEVLADESDEPITLFINSYGGSIYDGLAIIDTIKSIRSPVYALVRGKAMSMAFDIAVSTDYVAVFKSSRLMTHNASSFCEGRIDDMEVSFQEAKTLNNQLAELVTSRPNCKISAEEYISRTKQDWYMSAKEALELGFIDNVIEWATVPEEDATSDNISEKQ